MPVWGREHRLLAGLPHDKNNLYLNHTCYKLSTKPWPLMTRPIGHHRDLQFLRTLIHSPACNILTRWPCSHLNRICSLVSPSDPSRLEPGTELARPRPRATRHIIHTAVRIITTTISKLMFLNRRDQVAYLKFPTRWLRTPTGTRCCLMITSIGPRLTMRTILISDPIS